ncbi:2098_t:CDS:2 [Funneliformis caledonium]|uniref:2098_t:CDS:1 n=1 Tax=Funneliformis caledonium TaxID=1117310 RepID=A0A9N9CX18_9GLOM|nr:2098_t:CDS:2 [Funneliformis caledonium]
MLTLPMYWNPHNHVQTVQLQVLRTERETRTRKLKAYDTITAKTKNERARNLAKLIFGVQHKDLFQVDYGEIDEDEVKLKRTFTVKAIDQGQIPRDSYRVITSLSNDLVKE